MNLGRRGNRLDEPEVNVTSLIDVVLLLLIFFMLSTTFVDEGRVNIQLPEATTQSAEPPPRLMEIGVLANGSYRINGQELLNNNPATLRAALLNAAGADREQSILIRADANASHQSVVTAMDIVARAGFKSVSIATINQPRPAGRN